MFSEPLDDSPTCVVEYLVDLARHCARDEAQTCLTIRVVLVSGSVMR